MTQEQHPITAPPELFKRWETFPRSMALKAAYRAGADMELEACCEWLDWQNLASHRDLISSLRAARRLPPPSLKEQALMALDSATYQPGTDFKQIDPTRSAILRRALEQLDDD